MQQTLFDFDRPSKADDIAIAKKVKQSKKRATTVRGSGSALLDKINLIRRNVEQYLGQYKDQYITIQDEETLKDYVAKCVECGEVAIDTETTGLDPMTDKIVGVCLYSPACAPAYIPMRHRSYITLELIPNQLAPEIVGALLKPLEDIQDDIMFNAVFDTRMCMNDIGVNLNCTWDTSLASRLMNENEKDKGLKKLHQKYVLNGEEDAFSFSELFNKVGIDLMPIDIATLYGAHDAIITYELKKFQEQYLYYEEDKDFSARNGMNGVSWAFFNIEMPCVKVVCRMENNGVLIDVAYANQLSVEYHKKLEDTISRFNVELEKISDKILDFRRKNPGVKLDNPININSPTQLAILFYDILGKTSPDKRKPRGTGKAILKSYDMELSNIVLEYKAVEKLLSTYIDKLPNCLNPNDGKIHCKFNSYGANTGRFSSSDPNLQNIPSHNKDIRKMFVASDGYLLMSSDFSQQEPKCLAALCKRAGDPQMYDTFMAGKDIYAEIASKSFHKPYEECLEFRPDRTVNPEGKERRSRAKVILLSLLYGKSDEGIAKDLNCSLTEAKSIKASVFTGFPAIRKFEKDSIDFAYDNGYVTTVCGRKRRLPDIQLDKYEFSWYDTPKNIDYLDFDDEGTQEVPYDIQDKYWDRLERADFSGKQKIIKQAKEKDGIRIIDNTGKIQKATRQIVNSSIQGSAADLTKVAMIELDADERMKELGFRLLIQVHDEVIAEAPKEHIKECSKRLAMIMSQAAEKILEMPIRCDVEVSDKWYGKDYEFEDDEEDED